MTPLYARHNAVGSLATGTRETYSLALANFSDLHRTDHQEPPSTNCQNIFCFSFVISFFNRRETRCLAI